LATNDDFQNILAQQCHAMPCRRARRRNNAGYEARAGAGECHPHGVGRDLEFPVPRTTARAPAPRRVADERIGQPQVDGVERTRNRHADRLPAGSAEILTVV
jgi:hypothetical protein